MSTKDQEVNEATDNNVEEISEMSEETSADPLMDQMTQQQHMVNSIIQVVWQALAQANESGMPLTRDGAAIAFTEILIRLTVAHAKQTEGGAERFKEMFDL